MINIISTPEKLSKLIITKGHQPKENNEIVLGEQLKGFYHMGKKIKNSDNFKLDQYKVVSFATSSVYMKKTVWVKQIKVTVKSMPLLRLINRLFQLLFLISYEFSLEI